MTRIDFYVDVDDRIRMVGRLGAKVMARSVRMLVLAPDEAAAEQINQQLWTQPATGFLPHCMQRDAVAPVTPIVITADPQCMPFDDLLLNLCDDSPVYFARFQRLIEIVTTDPDSKQAGRARYRFYRDRGYEIHTHSMPSSNT